MKRLLDVVVALTLLILLSPLFVVIAVAITFDSAGPVLYRQRRRGHDETSFVLLKFRTMTTDADARLADVLHLDLHAKRGDPRMFKIPDDPRVTRVGAVLRRHSIDELAQLWNVIRGDMSLVGPRPLMLMEDVHVGPEAAARRMVRPGLTGPWQVSGRNDLSFDQMLELDCAYVHERSTFLDIKLIMRTLPVIVRPQSPC